MGGTLFAGTIEDGLPLFVDSREQMGGPTSLAGCRNRTIRKGILAGRILIAAVEDAAVPAGPFHELPLVATVAGNAHAVGFCSFAAGIIRACPEPVAGPGPFQDQLATAFLTGLLFPFCLLTRSLSGTIQRPGIAAFRITRTGEERAKLPMLHLQGKLAFRATLLFVCFFFPYPDLSVLIPVEGLGVLAFRETGTC
jgi:hypothetical protein